MRLILTFLLMLTLGTSVAQAAPEYDYTFKEGTQCVNPAHDENVAGLPALEKYLVQTIKGVEEANYFQRAWLEVLNVEETNKLDGTVDFLMVYKNYPSLGMVIAFKDGCFIGYLALPLDQLNKFLARYEEKSKGL